MFCPRCTLYYTVVSHYIYPVFYTGSLLWLEGLMTGVWRSGDQSLLDDCREIVWHKYPDISLLTLTISFFKQPINVPFGSLIRKDHLPSRLI